MATHSSILAWRIPMNTRARQATVHEGTKSQTGLTLLSMNTRTSLPFLLFFFLSVEMYFIFYKC